MFFKIKKILLFLSSVPRISVDNSCTGTNLLNLVGLN
eukprot:SAG11_NODE_342_length_10454_cov_11.233079_4_plen_37_part_00